MRRGMGVPLVGRLGGCKAVRKKRGSGRFYFNLFFPFLM